MYTDREICKALTRDVGCALDRISEAMVTVGTLLREKGGPRDREIRGKIEGWASDEEHFEFSFPEVMAATLMQKERKMRRMNSPSKRILHMDRRGSIKFSAIG
jgi:hypothetical protein